MRKILFILSLFLTVSLSGQILPGVIASQRVVAAAGGANYTDDFEAYTAGALATQGNWVATTGTMNIADVAGDNVVNPGSATYSGVLYNATFADNQYSQAVIQDRGSQYIGLSVRASGSGATYCGYSCVIAPTGAVILDRITNGAATNLATSAADIFQDGDVLKVSVAGSEISVFQNGSLCTALSDDGKVTDATYTSGKAGLSGYSSGTVAKLDDWEGGDL